MSDRSAYESEMWRFARLSDREADALFAGDVTSTNEELAEVAGFLRDASLALEEAPAGLTEARHIAAIVETAQVLAQGAVSLPEGETALIPRRKLMSRDRSSSLAAKIACAAILTFTAFSGAAYAGVLPDPVQRGVADVGGTIGLSLPGREQVDNVDQGDVNDVNHGQVGDSPTGDPDKVDTLHQGTADAAQHTVDAGAQNDVDDRPQNDVDDGPQTDVNQGAQINVDEGPQNDVDDEAENDVDDGSQNGVDDEEQDDVDDGPQNNVDEGAQNDVDDQAENDVDEDAEDEDEGAVQNQDAGAENDSDHGSQEDGED